MSALGPEIDHAKVSEIPASIVCYFEEEPATLDLSVEAYLHTDSIFTAASAAASDVAGFLSNRGQSQSAAKKLGALQQSRLSVERFETIVSNDKTDRGLLFELAIGIRAPVSTGFEPNGQFP